MALTAAPVLPADREADRSRDTDFLALAVHRQQAEKGGTLPGRIFAAGPDWVLSTYECDGQLPRVPRRGAAEPLQVRPRSCTNA